MSNIVWSVDKGWHNGADVSNNALVRSFTRRMARYRLTEYAHDGHPEVASQYSQGTFTIGTREGTLDDIVAELRFTLEMEAATRADGATFDIKEDGDDTFAEVTLTVSEVCECEDHESEACECWEYVHTLGAFAELIPDAWDAQWANALGVDPSAE